MALLPPLRIEVHIDCDPDSTYAELSHGREVIHEAIRQHPSVLAVTSPAGRADIVVHLMRDQPLPLEGGSDA